jgi:tRNA pseudouridine38-40 synthase
VVIHAKAKSFLHRQVRMMVGALVYVGLEKWTPAHLESVLHGKKTLAGAMTAPAHGLYLMHVGYETM